VNTSARRKAVWVGNGCARVLRVIATGGSVLCFAWTATASVAAQAGAPQSPPGASASVPLPTGYVIGVDDVLSIVFWSDKGMSADAVVRPDGMISLPLLNDVLAAGLTPDQLRAVLDKAAAKYSKEPNAAVMVKAINSRKVHVLGNVTKPGTYSLTGEMTVLQLLALAGGLQEYADAKHIVIMRKEGGSDRTLKFNYKDVIRQKNLSQNVTLKPGDTIVVP
jgi:polysaccharide export outer membrane protein